MGPDQHDDVFIPCRGFVIDQPHIRPPFMPRKGPSERGVIYQLGVVDPLKDVVKGHSNQGHPFTGLLVISSECF